MSMIPIIGALVAISNANWMSEQEKQQEQKEQEQLKKQKAEEECSLLLLRGDDNYMEIGTTERVVTSFIRYTHYYDGKRYHCERKYVSEMDGEEVIKDTFNEILQFVLDKYQAKGVQVIPHSVSEGMVVTYLLLLKISDNQKKEKEKSLLKLADKMTEDIRTAW